MFQYVVADDQVEIAIGKLERLDIDLAMARLARKQVTGDVLARRQRAQARFDAHFGRDVQDALAG